MMMIYVALRELLRERERERERESQKKGNFRDENGELW